MAVTPHTNLRLIKLPIELDSKNQLTFGSITTQTNYFLSLNHLEVDNFTYQRRDNVIRYPEHIDNIIMFNYVMYRNDNYTNKWFYAFITNMRYINDNMTEIEIKTDVFQTWQFNLEYKQSFVEREHVTDDTIGLHTIPEGLETGDYISNSVNNYGPLTDKCIVVASTVDLDNDSLPNIEGGYYDGIYSGVKYFAYGTASVANANIRKCASAGKAEAIKSVFMAPINWIDTGTVGTAHGILNADTPQSHKWSDNFFGSSSTVIKKPVAVNGYTPRNNKLFCYPYNYLLLTNNQGASAIYNYEYFSHPTDDTLCDFEIDLAITPGCSIRAIPLHYKNISKNNNEGLNLGKLPICSWDTDVYTNWLTQNGVSVALGVAGGITQIGLGVASAATGVGALAGVGAIASGIGSIAGTMGNVYEHSIEPEQAEGNINSGDITYSLGFMTFSGYKMSIKQENAKVIDKFFDMFGYKVTDVKIPNINNRPNWNYVKLIDANIHGFIPTNDLEIIKNMFNSGITLWHNPATFLDYTQNNK